MSNDDLENDGVMPSEFDILCATWDIHQGRKQAVEVPRNVSHDIYSMPSGQQRIPPRRRGGGMTE